MKKKPKKVRRVVLGVGHPWFTPEGKWEVNGVRLMPHEVMNGWAWVELDIKDLGNWNKIRLVAEVLK